MINDSCNDFNLAVKSSFSNVCVFKNGAWQLGNLVFNQKSEEHTFVHKKTCDQGITTIASDLAADVVSPSSIDLISEKKDSSGQLIVVKNGKKIESKMTKNPLSSAEVPLLCYRAVAQGVPATPVACSLFPNEKDYCEFVVSPNKSYLGNWWVQYISANKNKPVVCLGGIKSSNLVEMKENFGESVEAPKVVKEKMTDFVSKLKVFSVDSPNEMDFKISGCYYNLANGQEKYSACEDADIEKYEKKNDIMNLVTPIKHNHCYVALDTKTNKAKSIYMAQINKKNIIKQNCVSVETVDEH